MGYDGLEQAVLMEHARRVAWAEAHAWKYEELRAARRPYRAIVADAIRAVAERLAPPETATGVESAISR